MNEQAERRNPVEELGEEFLSRHRRGERPTVAEYAVAHPQLADEIENLFPAMVAMEQFKKCKLSSDRQPVQLDVGELDQLGDYRIIREIGRGGMGVVYEAEQQSLGRHVAVKVFPRQTLGNSRQLKRFHREARTAARLHHTNIVPVFGVGEQDGLHYYVMQRIVGISLDTVVKGITNSGAHADDLERSVDETEPKLLTGSSTDVSGIRITDVASELLHGRSALSPSQPSTPPKSIAELALGKVRNNATYWRSVAEVGIQVANALDYAHAQSVCHRDIKPANLLLDAQGTVWVTDFGLATALEAEKLSNPGDVAGTLRFMAPEHVKGDHDHRSDIYSLGLTLYELLTLQPAFSSTSRAELIRMVIKGDLTPPRQRRPEIPRDLEAIILKATSVEPHRRYQSASKLAEDLSRFLEDRPTRARRIGSLGRAWRWTRRNPAIAALSMTLLVVIVMSFLLVGGKWREAVAENRRAEENVAIALESMDQILERFASSWMAHPMAPASEEAEGAGIDFQMAVSDHSAEVLQDALKFYDRFAQQNATNPRLQRDTAKVHRRVGDIYERLGQYGKAEEAYQRALDILASATPGKQPTLASERAITLNQLGLALYATSRFDEAEQRFRLAKLILIDIAERGGPISRYELARTNSNHGEALFHCGRKFEAEESHRQAISVLKELVADHPSDVDYRLALARACRIYYPFVAFGRGDSDPEAVRAEGIKILETLVNDHPAVPDYQCELSQTLATVVSRPPAESQQHTVQLERAVALARHLTVEHPSIPRYRALLARALKTQARLLTSSAPQQSEGLLGESVATYRALASDFPDVPAYHVFLSMSLHSQARRRRERGDLVDARQTIEEAISELEEYVRRRPDSRLGRRMLAWQHDELATTLRALGEGAAAAVFEESKDLRDDES